MITSLRTYILDDAAISAIIGDRFFPEVALQIDGTQAYAVYSTLSSTTINTHNDSGLLVRDLIDISVHAPTITQVYELSELLRTILSNKRVLLGSIDAHIVWQGFNTGYSNDDEIYNASITLEITWS
jgi:hypothetical protein